MSCKIWFDPTSDKWVLSDGEHYLEVPHWAREIIADEFERETRQLKTENDKLRNDADLLRAMLSQVHTEKRCYMAENAKLRDGAYAMRQLYEDELKHALAENAKLREQVASFIELSQDMVIYAGQNMGRYFAKRLRKLGVPL